jgi:hypothetical protein
MPAHSRYLSSLQLLFSTALRDWQVDGVTATAAKAQLRQLLAKLPQDGSAQTSTALIALAEQSPLTPAVDELIRDFTRTFSVDQSSCFLNEFLLALKADGCSPATIRNYRSDISQFLSFANFQPIEKSLNKPKLAEFVLSQREKGLKDGSIERKLKSIHQFGNWLVSEQILTSQPVSTYRVEEFLRSAETKGSPKPELTVPKQTESNETSTAKLPGISFTAQEKKAAGVVKHQEIRSRLQSRLDQLSGQVRRQAKQLLITYFNLALLVVFFLGLAALGYQQFFLDAPTPLAYPSTPIRPNRVLSFQGRLTDSASNPITVATNFAFRLYDSGPGTGGTNVLLWNSGTCSVTPDQDGIFSTGLGSDCGSEIASNVFSENANVWLEVQVASETLTPRQQIKTVAYALNSETLQGYPISATESALRDTVLVMNSSGQVVLGENSPTLQSVSGTFYIQGQNIQLQTTTGSNGDIILAPDGLGGITLTKYLEAPGATLSATYAGGTALTVAAGPSATANILNITNSAGSSLSVFDEVGYLGIGTSNPAARIESLGTTEQLRLSYDAANYASFTTSSGGDLTITPTGADTTITGDLIIASNGTTTFRGVEYTWPSSVGSDGYILSSTTGGGLSWVDPAGAASSAIYWNQANGTLFPKNSTVDLLVGSQATASAKFAVLNVNSGTPTASISTGLNGAGAYLTAAGNLQTTNRQTLSLGGSTTGNTTVLNTSGTEFVRFDATNSRVGIGLTAPAHPLDVSGNIRAYTSGSAYSILYPGNLDLKDSGGQPMIRGVDNSLRIGANNSAQIRFSSTGLRVDPGAGTGIAAPTTRFEVAESGTVNFAVTSAGNVGIGTAAPGSKLDVVGDIFAPTATFSANYAGGTALTLRGGPSGTANILNITNSGGTSLSYFDSSANLYLNAQNDVRFADADSTNYVAIQAPTTVGTNYNLTLPAAPGTSGQVLYDTDGAGTLGWTNAAVDSSIYWNQANGSLYPKNSTVDLLVGSQATASAKFAVLNINNGTPTASVSTGVSGTSAYLTAAGNLQTTNNLSLSLGGSTTGNIILNSDGVNRVGIGTTTPNHDLHIYGSGPRTFNLESSDSYVVLNLTSGTGFDAFIAENGEQLLFSHGGQYDAYIDQNHRFVIGDTAVTTGGSLLSVKGNAAFGATYYASAAPANGLIVEGNVGIGDTTPDVKLEVLATTEQLRLTHTDGTADARFTVDSGGDLTIVPSGSELNITGNLDVSGTLTSGTANAFTVSATGVISTITDETINGIDISAGAVSDITTLTASSTITFSGLNTAGGIIYAQSGGVLGVTAAGNSGECLLSGGASTPTWGSCAGAVANTIFWNQADGALFAKNSTVDLLIGGQATTSAKFSVLNVNNGTPTASVSTGVSGTAAYLTATGNLQTANNMSLSLGGSTTGNILLNSDNSNRVGIGTATPADDVHIVPNVRIDGEYLDLRGSYIRSSGTNIIQHNASNIQFLFDTLHKGKIISFTSGGGSTGLYLQGNTGLPIIFETDGANERMRITSAGNVGIGTTVPGAKLTVNGDVFAPIATFSANYAGGTPLTLRGGPSGTASILNITNSGGTALAFFGSAGDLTLNAQADLRLADADSTNYVAVQAPTTVGTNYNLTLPDAPGVAGQVLYDTDGAGTLGWTAAATAANLFWGQTNGALHPYNSTVDLLVGSPATASAKFAVLNVTDGTPTASVSTGVSGTAAYLTAAGNLQTANNLSLTLGGSTTGNIVLNDNTYLGSLTTGINIDTIGVISDVDSLVNINDSVDITGSLTTSGNAAINGGTITSTSSLTLTPTTTLTLNSTGAMTLDGSTSINIDGDTNIIFKDGGTTYGTFTLSGTDDLGLDIAGNNFILADSDLLNVGGIGAVTYNAFANSATSTSHSLSGDASLFISGSLEVDGASFIDNALTISGTTTITGLNTPGGIIYAQSGGALAVSAAGNAGECLLSGAASTPTWGSCAGAVASTIFWNQADGSLFAKNSTVDLLIGGQSTASAKFSVLNVNNGTPTASVSSGVSGTAAYLTAAGSLQTANRQTLILGGTTTGNIDIRPNGETDDYLSLTSDGTNLTLAGVGTPNLTLAPGGTLFFHNANNSLTTAGLMTIAGDLAVNGDDITSDGTLTLANTSGDTTIDSAGDIILDVAGNDVLLKTNTTTFATLTNTSSDLTLDVVGANFILANGDLLNIGGLASNQTTNTISGTATPDFASDDNDLYIEDILEVEGSLYVGGVQITNNSLWRNTLNVYHPAHEYADIVDLVIGGTSTASANVHFSSSGWGVLSGQRASSSLLTLNDTGSTNIVTLQASSVELAKITAAGHFIAPQFSDYQNNAYFLDPAASGTNTSLAIAGRAGVGDDTPDYKLEIFEPDTTPDFALSDASVAHGLTSLAQTDVLSLLTSISTTAGGAQWTAISDTDAQALSIRGVIGSTDPTDATSAIKIIGAKASGTSLGDLGALETVFQVANNDDTAALTVLGNANVGIRNVNPGEELEVTNTSNVTFGLTATSDLNALYLGSVGDFQAWSANRNPVTGTFYNTSKAAAGINLTAINGSSTINFYTASANNTAPTERMTIGSTGLVGIGDSTADYLLELHDATATPTFALSDDDVAHGMTTLAETDVFGHFTSVSGTSGGLQITGLSDSDANPLTIKGVIGSTDPNDTQAAIKLVAVKANGTSSQSLAAAETMLLVTNNNASTGFLITANGNLAISTTSDAQKKIKVVGTNADALNYTGQEMTISQTEPATATLKGIDLIAQLNTSTAGTQTNLFGIDMVLRNQGSAGTITDMRGYNITPTVNTGTTATNLKPFVAGSFTNNGTIGTYYGLDVQGISNAASKTITEYRGVYINDGSNSGTWTTAYGLYVDNINAASTNYGIYSNGGNNYFAGNVGIGDTTPTEATLVIGNGGAGNVFLTLDTAGTTNSGVCWDAAGVTLLYDCDGTPTADYMEMYPTANDVEVGNVVTVGSQNVTTTQGQSIKQLVKTNDSYQTAIIGVVSDPAGAGDFNSIGYNINDSDRPMPIALNGRVPVKVSMENGVIQAGDAITSSSIPGIAMKATEAGPIIGYALEENNGSSSTVMIFINIGWYQPNIADSLSLTETGELVVTQDVNGTYQAVKTDSSFVTRIGHFGEAVIARLEAGLVRTQELIASISIETPRVQTDLISPFNGNDLTFKLGQGAQNNPAELIVKNSQDETVATIDDQGNATFSGQLNATSARVQQLESKVAEFEQLKAQTALLETATVSGTLYAGNIDGLQEKIAEGLSQPSLLAMIIGDTEEDATAAASVAKLFQVVDEAGYSATGAATLNKSLSELNLSSESISITADAAFINSYFEVNGNTYLNGDLGVQNQILVGEGLSIASGIIDQQPSAAQPEPVLQIQPSGGRVEILAGVLSINAQGQVTITGDLALSGNLRVNGTLLTNLLQPTDFGNPLQVQIAGAATDSGEIKESRFEIINELGAPVATISADGRAAFAGGLSVGSQDLSGETSTPTTNQTSGKATIAAGTSDLTIKTDKLSADSLIYVTPVGSTGNQVLYVKSQTVDNPATSENEAQFVVGFDNTTGQNVQFNWWIVN